MKQNATTFPNILERSGVHMTRRRRMSHNGASRTYILFNRSQVRQRKKECMRAHNSAIAISNNHQGTKAPVSAVTSIVDVSPHHIIPKIDFPSRNAAKQASSSASGIDTPSPPLYVRMLISFFFGCEKMFFLGMIAAYKTDYAKCIKKSVIGIG